MALSNISRANLGGGIELISGNYSHTAAAASETQDVDGEVIALVVNPRAAAGSQVDVHPNGFSVSTSGAVRTVTFLQNAPISDGTFCILIRKGC